MTLASRRINVCEETAREMRGSRLKAQGFRCNATNENDVAYLVDSVVKLHDKLDVFVCNAGGPILDKDFPDASTEAFRETIMMNINTTFICAQTAARVMIKHGHGKIITVGSIHGVMGTDKRLYDGLDFKRSSIVILRRKEASLT